MASKILVACFQSKITDEVLFVKGYPLKGEDPDETFGRALRDLEDALVKYRDEDLKKLRAQDFGGRLLKFQVILAAKKAYKNAIKLLRKTPKDIQAGCSIENGEVKLSAGLVRIKGRI